MRDGRKSSRRPTATSCVRCELQLGAETLSALLLNESRTGFGVLVAGMPNIATHQRARIHNYRGWFDCQIVYAMEVLPKTTAIYRAAGVYDVAEESDEAEENETQSHITAYDIDKFTKTTTGPWFRLGIRWLRQIDPSSVSAAPVASGSLNPMEWIKNALPSLFHH
jgi:hypothetical protein